MSDTGLLKIRPGFLENTGLPRTMLPSEIFGAGGIMLGEIVSTRGGCGLEGRFGSTSPSSKTYSMVEAHQNGKPDSSRLASGSGGSWDWTMSGAEPTIAVRVKPPRTSSWTMQT